MTLFFRGLGDMTHDTPWQADADLPNELTPAWYVDSQLDRPYREKLAAWLAAYHARVHRDGRSADQRRVEMHAVNPRYVLRNYLAQLAIDEVEKGNFAKVDELLEVLRHPYTDQPGKEEYAARRPDWAMRTPTAPTTSATLERAQTTSPGRQGTISS